jgi:hypothetical protein
MEMDGTEMMPLVWERVASSRNERKWNEPRPGYSDSLGIIYTSFWDIYLALKPSPDFKKVGCGTPWFDWGDLTRQYCAPGDCQ